MAEYETALHIQSKILAPHDRILAQTHLFIALALELIPNNQFDGASQEAKIAEDSFRKAVEQVQITKQVLSKREDYLKGQQDEDGKEGSAGKDDNPSRAEKDQEELKDLASLQIELDNKVGFSFSPLVILLI